MSSRVKQANFRLPLEYMSMIDDFASRSGLTKAAVIMRALDCMKASYDSGHDGMPVTSGGGAGDSSAEVASLQDRLNQAQARVQDLESQVSSANARADAAQASAGSASSMSGASDAEVARLKAVVASQEATLAEKNQKIAAKESELASKNAEMAATMADLKVKSSQITEKDMRIATLEQRLAMSGTGMATQMQSSIPTVQHIDSSALATDDPAQAMHLFNMLGGVMGAFKQQVEDARVLGERNGKRAARNELKDVISKARNDGYREAMTFLDDRVSTARESGAREERARIANMRYFERRRYLRIHYA